VQRIHRREREVGEVVEAALRDESEPDQVHRAEHDQDGDADRPDRHLPDLVARLVRRVLVAADARAQLAHDRGLVGEQVELELRLLQHARVRLDDRVGAHDLAHGRLERVARVAHVIRAGRKQHGGREQRGQTLQHERSPGAGGRRSPSRPRTSSD
jgi:hypothetical protein